MSKRLKSGFITLVSIVAVVITTPAWADFVTFANTKLLGWGIPAVVTTLLAVFISELWKYLLNKHTLSKMGKIGSRVENELY